MRKEYAASTIRSSYLCANPNNLRKYQNAEFSIEAWKLHQSGEKVLIEHVSPLRDLTRKAIDKVNKQISDQAFKTFVKRNYKLVLLGFAHK
jgi:hypothetical protein